MSNLPPDVSISNSDAPWNQDHPTPDWECEECGRYGEREELDDDSCPECGGEITDY